MVVVRKMLCLLLCPLSILRDMNPHHVQQVFNQKYLRLIQDRVKAVMLDAFQLRG